MSRPRTAKQKAAMKTLNKLAKKGCPKGFLFSAAEKKIR